VDTDIIEKNCHVRHIFACQLGQQEFVGENLVEPVFAAGLDRPDDFYE
jgi:hypothetical protein